MNKKGDYCTLSPEWIINSTAQAEADMTLLMVKDIGRLDEGTKFIDETAEIWYIRALKKLLWLSVTVLTRNWSKIF